MKKYRLAVTALVAALLTPATHAGQLSLNAGFALAQNSGVGGSEGGNLPDVRSSPLSESPIRSGRDAVVGAGDVYLHGSGDEVSSGPVGAGVLPEPSIASAPDAIAPTLGVHRNGDSPLLPAPSKRIDYHRWQSLVPGAIK